MILTRAMLLAGVVAMIGRFHAIASAEDVSPVGNLLLDQLVQQGIKISGDEDTRLIKPTLTDGLSAAEQRARVAAIPDAHYDWDALTRHSVVAPFVLKIGAAEEPSPGIGSGLDLWFVVYGDLDSLISNDFLQNQFRSASSEQDAENQPRVKMLSAAELAKRGIAPPQNSTGVDYTAGEFTLLDKVRIFGTIRSVKTHSTNSLVVASVLEPAFADDAEFPNGWRSITRDSAGKRQLGTMHIYAGFASYVKATRLVEPVGAVLIEYHAAFAEPREWFNGANLLRSKLPIVAQDAVRKLRRSLGRQKVLR